jgi:hypothetical protein
MYAEAVRSTAARKALSDASSHQVSNSESHLLYLNNFTDRLSVSTNGRNISEGFKDPSRADL